MNEVDPRPAIGRAAALVGVELKPPEENTYMVSVRVPRRLADQVKAAAKADGVSIARWVKSALTNAMNQGVNE